MQSTDAAIQFDGVRKAFGPIDVLRGLDLSVPVGKLCALVGVNGAGKTTGIKSLLDFCAVDGGHIEIFGAPHDRPAARERLAFLPERFNPPYFLTGAEYLRTMATLYSVRFDLSRAESVCDELEFAIEALQRPVRTYSKGMAQKLGLAGAFLSERELLLLDEPLSGLDPKARILVKRQLRKACDEGRTVFFTTHMLADLETICDLMFMLDGGRCVFAGSVTALREQFGEIDLEAAFLRALTASD
ncbi:MAG: ABC transporter ATP-binding protein [Pseudomonadota bacterium]